MQQTEKYKLNLIERDDVFSPDALNENMEKVEAAIAAGDAELDSRVTMLEAKKIVVGTYVVQGSITVELGFTPIAVVIANTNYSLPFGSILPVTDSMVYYHGGGAVNIVPNGFTAKSPTNDTGKYNYIAFG